MTSQPQQADAGTKLRILCEIRKYLWNYLLFGEFCHDSTKKKALIFVFAAPKFANTISRNNRGGRAPWYVVCFRYNTPGTP